MNEEKSITWQIFRGLEHFVVGGLKLHFLQLTFLHALKK
jgi:hypothetical protein